jgi:hypothetical protein
MATVIPPYSAEGFVEFAVGTWVDPIQRTYRTTIILRRLAGENGVKIDTGTIFVSS